MNIDEAIQKLNELMNAAHESNIDANVPTGQAILMATKSLEAWGKIKEELKQWYKTAPIYLHPNDVYNAVQDMFDTYLKEIENGSHSM